MLLPTALNYSIFNDYKLSLLRTKFLWAIQGLTKVAMDDFFLDFLNNFVIFGESEGSQTIFLVRNNSFIVLDRHLTRPPRHCCEKLEELCRR